MVADATSEKDPTPKEWRGDDSDPLIMDPVLALLAALASFSRDNSTRLKLAELLLGEPRWEKRLLRRILARWPQFWPLPSRFLILKRWLLR